MDESINDLLLDDLVELHAEFKVIIKAMQDDNIAFPYDSIIQMESNSYSISFNAISRMNKSLQDYNYCLEENTDFFNGEKKLYIKYIMLYLVSIIIIRIFSKTLSSAKLNEIWYALLGLILGTVNVNIINQNINDYRYGTKENRELINQVKSYQEDYNNDYKIASREIDYLRSLNRNLLVELHNSKKLIKK